jgi:hypothetical protein
MESMRQSMGTDKKNAKKEGARNQETKCVSGLAVQDQLEVHELKSTMQSLSYPFNCSSHNLDTVSVGHKSCSSSPASAIVTIELFKTVLLSLTLHMQIKKVAQRWAPLLVRAVNYNLHKIKVIMTLD